MQQRSLFFDPPVSTKKHPWKPVEPPSLDGIEDVYLDFETSGLKWWEDHVPVGAAVATRDGRKWYLPWGHDGGGNLPWDSCERFLKRELRGKRIKNLNTRFDLHMGRKVGVDLEAQGCKVGDVGHYAALLDDNRRRGFDLNTLGMEQLGIGKVRGIDLSHGAARYHAGEIAEYAMRDVDLVRQLDWKYGEKLAEQNLQRVADLEDRTIYPVVEMEKNGTIIDTDLLHRFKIELEQVALRELTSISRQVGFQVRPNATKDLARLFRHLSIPITHFTEDLLDPKPSFDESVLRSYDDPLIAQVLRARKLLALNKNYVTKYSNTLEPGAILRYALHQLRADEGGTISGRFSSAAFSSKGWKHGANIQQVAAVEKQLKAICPRCALAQIVSLDDHLREGHPEAWLIRQLFLPAPGNLWLSADAAQIEYRLFAHYARSPKLLEAYEKDPWTNFHKLVYTILLPFAPNVTYKHTKNVNFAFVYGAGIKKIAEMLGLTRDEAEELVNTYKRTFPEVPMLLHKASKNARDYGFVKTLLGRRSRFPNRQRLHKALNGVIQGGAADIMKEKLIELHDARHETGFKMRFTVHDEVDGDAPDLECARKVGEILNRQSYSLRVPILWEVSTGENWARCA